LIVGSNPFSGTEHLPFHIGSGETVIVCIHGFPGSPAEFHPLAERLSDLGWAVDVPLLPGFGSQIDTLPRQTNQIWLASLLERVAELRRDYHQIILVGNSMGGALALQVAAHAPINGLVLLAPFWRLEHILWHSLPVLRYIIPKFKPFQLIKLDFSDEATRAGIRNFMPDVNLDDPETQKQIKQLELPLRLFNQIRQAGIAGARFCSQVTCPTMIIQGRQDDLVKPHTTRTLISRFTIPVTYTEVDAGHDLVKQPDQIVENIHQFVSEFRG